jgi:hypothetical protein
MGPFEMVAMIVAMGCGTGLVTTMVAGWVSVQKARVQGGSDSVAGELRALREEVQRLREQNADLMLTYDTTMQRLGAMAAPPVRQERIGNPGETVQLGQQSR